MKDELHKVSGGELSEPNPSTSLLGGLVKMWRDVWRHEYLVANFVRRDLRVKYRNSALGYFWSLLEPLLLSGVYVVLFTIVAGKPQRLYPLWVIIGVLSWRFFGTSLLQAISCLTANEGTIKSIYFPRCLFATASACSSLVMTSMNLLVAVPFMLYFGIVPTGFLLMVPLGLLLLWMLALGAGLGLACLNVVNRDVGHLFGFLVRVGLYISPVLWTVEMGRGKGAVMDYLLLNPTAVPITMIRNGITGQGLSVSPGQIAWSVACCVLAFVVGAMVFQRYEARVIKKL
jgi:lipopolysaccharide transport system permease protein